jgi:hypothetical protein
MSALTRIYYNDTRPQRLRPTWICGVRPDTGSREAPRRSELQVAAPLPEMATETRAPGQPRSIRGPQPPHSRRAATTPFAIETAQRTRASATKRNRERIFLFAVPVARCKAARVKEAIALAARTSGRRVHI